MRRELSYSRALSGESCCAGLAAPLFLVLLIPAVAATTSQCFAEEGRIQTLENSLRVATRQHAGPEELGNLWRALAIQYQKELDVGNAEDAYIHAIGLLRDTQLKAQYAASLHALAQVYVMESRLKEAQRELALALAIFDGIGDRRSAVSVRETVAVALMRDHKFREAEAEASQVVAMLESMDHPAMSELANAYTTRARALAAQGHPEAALRDATHAHSLATENTAANSIDSMVTLLVVGEVQMQAGMESEGERSIMEALKLERSRTDLPPVTSSTLEASMLEVAANSLRRANRKEDAKALEEQMRQAQSAARAGCGGCTVSVSSLLSE